jgi:hypothetical protein
MRSVPTEVELTRPLSSAFNSSEWLALAASPAFAMMALLTGVADDSPANVLCSMSRGLRLSGMPAMYLLMSAFHVAPWLKLIRRAPRVQAG